MVETALPDLDGADVVAVLTRAPSGKGKTRLFAELGRPSDPGLARALFLDTLDAVTHSRARVVVFVEPSGAVDEVAALVNDVVCVAQGDGDIGDRMRASMEALFRSGARRVAVVGADIPTLRPEVVNAAFRQLDAEASSLVLGPAADGGYYLIAAAAVPPVFERILWSTPFVLEQTLRVAQLAGLPVRLVDTLEDVDSVESLRRAGEKAPRTRAWIQSHLS